MASAANVKSANFEFLGKHDAVLVRYAALAERYVFEDPNSATVLVGHVTQRGTHQMHHAELHFRVRIIR
jgi:hypothetical protein